MEGFINPLGMLFVKFHVSPNILTLISFLLALISSIQIFFGNIVMGGLIFLISGFIDVLDGFVARLGGSVSKLGGFLDSVLDRFSDAIILSSIIYSGLCDLGFGLFVLVGGFMVSYIRCRGEFFGVSLAGVGFAERSERIIILSLGLMLDQIQLSMYILSFLIALTIIERLYNVIKFLVV